MSAPAASGAGPGVAVDHFPSEVRRLLATARLCIDTHVHAGGGRCAGCGDPWPCTVAVLAEHNLAAI